MRDEAACYGLLVCGAFAQLIVLDVFVAVGTTFAVFRLVRLSGSRAEGRLRRAARESIPVVAASLFLLATAVPVIVLLRRSGALYTGGTTGLWHDSVGSVVRISLLGLSPSLIRATLAGVGIGLAALAALAAFRLVRPRPADPFSSRSSRSSSSCARPSRSSTPSSVRDSPRTGSRPSSCLSSSSLSPPRAGRLPLRSIALPDRPWELRACWLSPCSRGARIFRVRISGGSTRITCACSKTSTGCG